MILPTRYTDLSGSLIGLGGYILKILDKNALSPDKCWEIFKKQYQKNISKKHTFKSFISAILILKMIDAIEINEKGEIYNVSFKALH